jgi:hypothetical protein
MDKYRETYPSEAIIKTIAKNKAVHFCNGGQSGHGPTCLEHFNPIASKALFAYVCFRKKELIM